MFEAQFVKWLSIDNVESVRDSRYFKEAKNVKNWVVTEKIDGTNFSITVTRDGEVKLAKRTSFITPDEKFFDLYDKFSLMEDVVYAMKDTLKKYNNLNQLTIYGEYFAPHVLNRVWYGKDAQFRFFGMMTIGFTCTPMWFSFCALESWLKNYSLEKFLVPVLAHYTTLEEACLHKNNNITTFADDVKSSVMEGVIITAYDEPVLKDGKKYIFKSKSEAFQEKKPRSQKLVLPKTEEELFIETAHNTFLEYCTENRMVSVFSKEGIPSKEDARKYILLFITDAKNDFIKEHPEYRAISEKEMKKVCNIGSLGFDFFTALLERSSNA